jgi:serine/threonine-protein kinase RsbW
LREQRDRRKHPFRLRAWIPSTARALNAAVEDVRRILDRCECDEDTCTSLEIALREALANAIDHGNEWREDRKVFLRCYAGPGAGVFIAVRDQGNGFEPESVPDPRSEEGVQLTHGRGLLLMRELMDSLLYRHGGREVVIYYRLAG